MHVGSEPASTMVGRSRRTLRKAGALLWVTLVGCVAIGCAKSSAATARTRLPPQVITARIGARDVPIEARAPVDLRALEQADVGSKVLGYIDTVFVDRGDRVKRGDPLAIVRPSDLPDQLAAARSSLGQAQATTALARTSFDRASKLAPQGVMSEQELQTASANLASAVATEASVKAQIAGLATRLGETRIESPIDGFVLVRRLDPGALVGPPGGGAIVTVVRIDRLRVFITVNEYDAGRVTIGKRAHVELDAMPNRSFAGAVVRLAPSFDPNTRTLEAEVQLPNENGDLRPGMYGRGSIVLETHPQVPVVPVAAVQISSDQKYVFVLHGTKVERRSIATGAEVDDGDSLEVRSGLAPGEEVVTAGADGLSNGTQVRVVRDQNPYTGTASVPSGSGAPRDNGAPATAAVR